MVVKTKLIDQGMWYDLVDEICTIKKGSDLGRYTEVKSRHG